MSAAIRGGGEQIGKSSFSPVSMRLQPSSAIYCCFRFLNYEARGRVFESPRAYQLYRLLSLPPFPIFPSRSGGSSADLLAGMRQHLRNTDRKIGAAFAFWFSFTDPENNADPQVRGLRHTRRSGRSANVSRVTYSQESEGPSCYSDS